MNSVPQPIRTIVADVQVGKRLASDIVKDSLAQAAKVQDRFRPFITLLPEKAQVQAAAVDARIKAGEKLPLAGVPFAVKDLIQVAGIPTTCGSRLFADKKAGQDAEVVRRLVSAGAVLIGTLNLHEFAFGFTGENATYGDCKNPWDAARIAGGSSSGSAVAVALNVCPFTLGSDTGGSIRHPAALSGVFGLKPTYGRVSRSGVAPLSWSMDHVGPLVRTAGDAAQVLKVLAGRDPGDESSSRRPVPDYPREIEKPIQGLRLGIPHRWFFEALQPAVGDAVMTALDKLGSLGCKQVQVTLPHLEEVVGAHRAILFPEASSYHEPFLGEKGALYSADIRHLLQSGLFFPAVDYVKAQRLRRQVRRAWAKVFDSVDCLVTPTSPIVATKFGESDVDLPGGRKPLVRAYLDFTLPFNFSGHPALSLPCGFTNQKLPIGLQLVGKPFDEATILRIAHHYQQVTDWHLRNAPG